MENQSQTPKKGLNLAQKVLIVATPVVASTSAFADGPDVSAGTAVIATGVAVIALIGAAKIIPNATIQVWGYVKQAFNRT